MLGESDAADITPGDVTLNFGLNIVISTKREIFTISADVLLIWPAGDVTVTDFTFLPLAPVVVLCRCSA